MRFTMWHNSQLILAIISSQPCSLPCLCVTRRTHCPSSWILSSNLTTQKSEYPFGTLLNQLTFIFWMLQKLYYSKKYLGYFMQHVCCLLQDKKWSQWRLNSCHSPSLGEGGRRMGQVSLRLRFGDRWSSISAGGPGLSSDLVGATIPAYHKTERGSHQAGEKSLGWLYLGKILVLHILINYWKCKVFARTTLY